MELLILLRKQLWLQLLIHAIVFFTSCCCCSTNLLQSSLSSPAAPIVAPPGNTTDLLALLSFKSLVTDPNGVLEYSWNATLHFCQWKGVTCGGHRHPQRVKALDLQSLNLSGPISPSLANLTFLRRLNLPSNQFHGHIPQELGRLSRLRFLNLSLNNLDGEIPYNLSYCKHLRFLSLRGNMLQGEIPNEFGFISTLQILSLSVNNLIGAIPSTLGNLSSLVALALYENNLNGNIPPELGSLSALKSLYLAINNLTGAIPSTLGNLSSLVQLNLGFNNLNGNIPLELKSREASHWNFLTSLTNCRQLRILNLNTNKLGGILPSTIGNLSKNIEWFTISFNQIHGKIPTTIGNLININVLSMSRNYLTDTIPEGIGNLKRLKYLTLHTNELSGELPSSLKNLTQLLRIYLADNNFNGRFPISFASYPYLTYLNLSHNKLSGTIPKEVVSLSSLTIMLDLSHNSLTGPIPSEIGALTNLGLLDMSENKLFGEIPSSLGQCQVLEFLHIQGNNLQGVIPQSLSNLKGIKEIDISRNNLSGTIPKSFGSLKLQYLNLSFNDFEGEVPTDGVFGNASAISIVGNGKLCGGIFELHLAACSNLIYKRKDQSPLLTIILSIIGTVLCLIILLCVLVVYKKKSSRKQTSSTTTLKGRYVKVSYGELFKATNGFSSANLIGTGSFGSVYKGVMDGGEQVVAVKVFNLENRRSQKSFMAECKILREARHKNLVKVVTACASIDFKGNDFMALVYNYMPNGSLEKWLHRGLYEHSRPRSLNFIQSLNIAIDVASGLDYLHHGGQKPIIHCDLKPSNILLDNDMCGQVGDFGLARFLSNGVGRSFQNSTSSIGIKGTIGYIAPEYGMGSEVSSSGDVYSLGIVLLEMFTGKSPIDDTFKDGMNLHKYVEMAFPERVMSIIDPHLLSNDETNVAMNDDIQYSISNEGQIIQDCIVSVFKVGLVCSEELPNQRMEMKNVLEELISIRNMYSA